MTQLVFMTGRNCGKSLSVRRMLEVFEEYSSHLRSIWTAAAKEYRRKNMDKYYVSGGGAASGTPTSGGMGTMHHPITDGTMVYATDRFGTPTKMGKRKKLHRDGKPKKPWE